MSIENLNEPLNTVAETNDRNLDSLVFSLLDRDMDLIQKLGDEPNVDNNLTAAELKAKFDEAGNIIKNYINETLVPSISDTVAEAEVRAAAEAERIRNENQRIATEATRKTAETARATAETGRVNAEASRVAAEQARETKESERETAEQTRRTNENARVAAEAIREDKEIGYVAQAKAWAEQAKEAAGGDFAPKTHAIQHAANGGDPITPAAIGAVALNGSNAMTGNLNISKSAPYINLENSGGHKVQFNASSSRMYIYNRNKENGDKNYRRLIFGNSEVRGVADAFRLGDVVDGKETTYDFIHSGNVAGHSLMKDGSNTMTGALKIDNSNPEILLTDTDTNTQGVLYQASNQTVIQNRNVKDNMDNLRQLVINNSAISSGLDKSLRFMDKVNGTSTWYNVLHTGNRELVVPLYTATVTTNWTADGDYYYQDIAVNGILATDTPIVDINAGSDNAANILYSESMCKVFRITTSANSIRVWATEAISTAFPIQIKVVR